MKLNWKPILIIILALILVSTLFFMITTTMSSPTVMELKMPKDESGTDNNQNSSSLTLVLLKNNMLYAYFGNDINNGRSLEIKEARKVILEGVQKFTRDSLIVLIKPTKEATYSNSVDILDEMSINRINKYKMVDLNKQEEAFLAKR